MNFKGDFFTFIFFSKLSVREYAQLVLSLQQNDHSQALSLLAQPLTLI